jgi:hypothetical protein
VKQQGFARGALRRLPFTLALILALIGVALLTGAHFAPLEARWLARLGFATRDLFLLDLARIVTSAVATHGGAVFWRALLAVAIFVGGAEWRTGSRRTVLVFSASHVLALLAVAASVSMGLRPWHPALAELLDTARDVGPSAGYFGCLALLCSTARAGWRGPLGIAIGLALLTACDFALEQGHRDSVALSAALAHVMAFPLGWLLALGSAPATPLS